MKNDYLKLIQKARSPKKIANYIRCFNSVISGGYAVFATSNKYQEILALVKDYELTAQIIENCETYQQARAILKEKKFI